MSSISSSTVTSEPVVDSSIRSSNLRSGCPRLPVKDAVVDLMLGSLGGRGGFAGAERGRTEVWRRLSPVVGIDVTCRLLICWIWGE